MKRKILTFTEAGYTKFEGEKYFNDTIKYELQEAINENYILQLDDSKLQYLPITYIGTIIDLSIETFGFDDMADHTDTTHLNKIFPPLNTDYSNI